MHGRDWVVRATGRWPDTKSVGLPAGMWCTCLSVAAGTMDPSIWVRCAYHCELAGDTWPDCWWICGSVGTTEREWWFGSLGSLYGSRTAYQCYLLWHGLVYICRGVWPLPPILVVDQSCNCSAMWRNTKWRWSVPFRYCSPPIADSSAPRLGWYGCPITLIPEYPAQLDSDYTDTDPDELLTAEATVHPPILYAGQAIPWTCSVCDMNLPSGMALYRHMRSVHPHDKPYSCKDCGSMYNNLKELSSHYSNIYYAAMVSCTKCDYASISKAWMR